MNKGNWIRFAHGPAAINDFLAAALHFGVVPLHAGKIELLVAGAAGHGASRAAPEADEHGWSAEHNQLVAGENRALLDVVGFNIAQAAGEHDRFVVATDFRRRRRRACLSRGDGLFVSAEIAVDGGATEFVIESRAAEWSGEHDIERGDDAAGFAELFFPRLDGARNF